VDAAKLRVAFAGLFGYRSARSGMLPDHIKHYGCVTLETDDRCVECDAQGMPLD